MELMVYTHLQQFGEYHSDGTSDRKTNEIQKYHFLHNTGMKEIELMIYIHKYVASKLNISQVHTFSQLLRCT